MKIDSWYLKFNGRIVPPDDFISTVFHVTKPSLCGLIYGKLGFKDGESAMLSPVKYIMRNMVYTESGSVYELGEPEPRYVAMYPNVGEDILRLFF